MGPSSLLELSSAVAIACTRKKSFGLFSMSAPFEGNAVVVTTLSFGCGRAPIRRTSAPAGQQMAGEARHG